MSTPFTGTAESRVYSRTRDNPARLAYGSYWTLWTLGLSRDTDQRSQLHDCLVEFPGAFAGFGDESGGESPDAAWRDEALPGEALPRNALPVVSEEDSQEYAPHVRVYCRDGLLVGERGNGASRIRSDSGKLDQFCGIIWQRGNAFSGNAPSGSASPGNAPGQRMEIPRARIVPQAIPSLPDRAGPSPGQRFQIGKPLEKARIVLRHAAHLRLLQHELGDKHAVRIAGLAPRQIARGAGPPGQQAAGERRFHLSAQFRFSPQFRFHPLIPLATLSSPL